MSQGGQFFYVRTKKLLDMFDNFRDEWDDFSKEHTSQNDFFRYVDAKISDLRKDIDWMRKVRPHSEEGDQK